jgi:hypothetical protein
MKAFVLTVLLSVFSLGYSAHYFVGEYKDYQASSECVAKYVSMGFERSAIEMDGDTCHLK